MLTRFTTLSLLAIAAMHVYWASGGRIGSQASVPTIRGAKAFDPGSTVTLAVAGAVFTAAAAVQGAHRGWGGPLPRLIALLAGLVFSGRSIGDFRLVGLTRRDRESTFARNDKWIYTPLCMVLSAGCFAAARGPGGGRK